MVSHRSCLETESLSDALLCRTVVDPAEAERMRAAIEKAEHAPDGTSHEIKFVPPPPAEKVEEVKEEARDVKKEVKKEGKKVAAEGKELVEEAEEKGKEYLAKAEKKGAEWKEEAAKDVRPAFAFALRLVRLWEMAARNEQDNRTC